jgi:hypothetical protein
MKNVFIAIGGSGAKVAEALVRLLAIGCPTRKQNGVYTSVGDSLQIWRIDPDRSAGAAVALQTAIRHYEDLQKHLSNVGPVGTLAGSRWALELDTRIRNLDPLQLPQAADNDNEIKTLAGVLDSQYGGLKRSTPLLTPFYAQKDLDVEVDRGFYQKPFIGAAIMAIFAASLRDETSPGGKEAGLTAFNNNRANFFICGSLHGGTGACGVPVMGKFLSARKKANPGWGWRVGGSLLAPYCVPPQPPFSALPEGEDVDDRLVDDLVKRHTDDPAFADLTPEKKRELVKQILLGFYADPDDMEARARQGLGYYKDYSADYFDELYLVGKPEPDKLKVWSNGGDSQRNPLNSAETVAALAALNFFTGANTGDQQSYVVGASTNDLNSQKMHLYNLPKYKLNSSDGADEIDLEKVFLATSVLHHLLLHQIPWNVSAGSWPSSIEGLRQVYKDNATKQQSDRTHFTRALDLLTEAMMAVLDPNQTVGWDSSGAAQVSNYLSGDANTVKEINEKIAKRMMSGEPKGILTLGRSAAKLTALEFGKWFPAGTQYSCGEYLRHVWSEIFARTQDITQVT